MLTPLLRLGVAGSQPFLRLGVACSQPLLRLGVACSQNCALLSCVRGPQSGSLRLLVQTCIRGGVGEGLRGIHSQAQQLVSRRLPPRLHTHIQTRGAKKKGSWNQKDEWRTRNKTVLTYVAAAGVGMIGMSYAAVPLYRLYCQASGLGGTAVAGHDTEQVETMTPLKHRVIKVTFNADTHASMQWNFRPQQSEIYLVPGETALAFYRAKNPTDKPVIGISTYNVVPFEAGKYFNKIQQQPPEGAMSL